MKVTGAIIGAALLTLVFDGKHAAIIDQLKAEKDEPGGLELVDPVFLSHFEVDIAMAFPAFFEYPSKFWGRSGLEMRNVGNFSWSCPGEATSVISLIPQAIWFLEGS
jgi:hypothetical protein